MNRDYRRFGIEEKTHYKLYKSGKQWITAGITVFSIGIGLTFTQLDQVKAATQTSSNDSDTSSNVSSDESSISNKAVVLKTSTTSSNDSSVISSSTSAASQSPATSDTQSTNADKTSSVASSATSESENASKLAASATSSTSNSSTTESSAASSATVGSSSQDKSAKTTSTSTSNSTTKASESKTLVSSTDTSTTSAASSKTNSVSGTETTDDSSSAGDTKVVSDVASESTSTTVNDTDTNTDNLSTVNSNNAALTTEKTALAAAVATKATRASLARAAATNSVEWVTTGTVNIDYGTYTQGLGGVTQVIDSSNLTVASGEPNLALYAKDASGGYLVDDKGNRVNLLYSLIRMGNTSTAFTVSYTNEAGVTSDVSGTEWTTLSNAGTYTITLTADGEEQITEINDLGNWGGYTFSDDTDVDSFMPTMDSFSGTYTAQIVITPATIVNGTTGNTITLGNAVQYYNGKSVTMLPQVTVSGADSGTVLRIVGGAVTNQSGTAVNVKDVILTSDDFDYTYSDGTSNLTKYDAGTYTLTLNTAGIAAMQKALGQNYNLIGYDDTGDPNIVGKGTVKKVALGLATSTKTTTYNGTAQGTDVSVASGSNYDNIVFTTSTGTNVNTSTNYPDGYTMMVVTADANQAAILAKNYTVTETDGTLTITPALLTVMTNDNPVTYDGQAHGTTVAVTGDNYDNLAFNAVSKDDGGTTTYINAGTYTMIGTTSGDTSNYTITYKNGTITIAKAAATITIPSKTYWADGTTKSLTATVTGAVNDETLNYTLTDGLQTTGTKIITATYDASDSVNQNYDITVTPGTLTVGDVTVEYDYGYTDAKGNYVVATSATGSATHSTDTSATDYLAYTTESQSKTGYTLSTDSTGLAANGTLSGTGGVVKYIYLANDETINVIYYDQTDDTQLTMVGLTGKYGTTDPYTTADAIAVYEKAGYKLVSSDFPSDGITYNVDGTVLSYTVLLAHKTTTVSVDSPGTPGDSIDPDNPDGPKYPDGTDTDSLSSTSKRTINYVYNAADGKKAADPVVQSTTFNRTAVVDEVTGKVTYGTWTTTDGNSQGANAQVTSPTITGYTPDQASVASSVVNQGDADSTVAVIYKANQESATVTFIDSTTGETLTSKTLTGSYGTTDGYSPETTIANYLNSGYQLDDSDFPEGGVVFDEDGTVKAYTINLSHKIATVSTDNPGTPGNPIDPDNPDGPKYPAGTDLSSLNKTVTRTITYNYADTAKGQAAKTVTQLVTFNRIASIDEVTGTVTYTDWATTEGTAQGAFDTVDSPVITGYTASQTNVAGVTVDEGATDSTANITYSANDETATVTFVDTTTKQNLNLETLNGKYGDTDSYSPQATIDSYLKAGYQLDNSDFPTDGVVYDEDGTVKAYTIELSHKTTTVNTDNPGTPDDPIDPDNPTGPKYPVGTDINSLNKMVTRTINYTYSDNGGQAAKSVKQSVTFARVGTIDEVTGNVTYTDWATTAGESQSTFDTVDSPTITGYTASQTNVASVTVAEGTADSTVNVTYAANDEKATVTFIDSTTGDTLDTENLKGSYGTTDDYSPETTIANYLNSGYQLDSSDFPKGGVVYDEDGTIKAYTIKLSHKTTTVNTDNPGTPGDPIDPDNPAGPKYPTGTDLSSLNKKVNRTITYTYADTTKGQAAETVTQTVTFNRIATIDQVTGAVSYTTWLTTENAPQGTFAKVDSPEITGYTASQTSADSSAVSETTNDVILSIVYTTNEESATVTFVDTTDDKTLSLVSLKGAYGASETYSPQATIDNYLKAGYQLDDSDFPINGIVYDEDGTIKAYTIKLSHKTATVNTDNPGTPGDPIDPANPDGPKYPNGTDLSNLNKTVTRTITYTYADGNQTGQAAESVSQSVTFNRIATIDEVTGKVTYTTWLTTDNAAQGNYASVDSPKITGYTASQDSVVSDAVNENDTNSTVQVTYAANEEKANVTFVDTTTGATLDGTETIIGNYGSSATYSPQATIDGYLKAGYQLDNSDFPTDGIAFDEDGVVKSYTIKLSHKTKNVDVTTPGQPGQPIDSDNPDGPKYPVGTDKSSLSKTITRTIKYQYQDGTQARDSVKQDVNFSRTATIDEVTGEVTYGQWFVTDTEDTTGSYNAVSTPEISGYTTDKKEIATATVTNADNNSQVMVTYSANSVDAGSAEVVYMDVTTDKQLDSTTLTGETGTHSNYSTQATIDQYIKAGYVLMSDGFPSAGIDFSDGTEQTYTVYLAHGTVPSTDQSQLTKVVTQTIHYRDPQGNTVRTDTTRNITFTRSGIIDQVTGDITYSDWSTQDGTEFSSLNALELTGYTAVTKATKQVNVDVTSQNDDQTLIYEKIAEPVTNKPETAVVQESPTQKPQSVQVSEKTVERNAPQPIKHVTTINKVKTPKVVQEHPVNKNEKAKTLPQTGDDQGATIAAELVGLSLATLLIGVGFISRKRRE